MSLILRVTSAGPATPLRRLLTAPLGLDVWEAKPEHLVVRASEEAAARLAADGYGVEQMHTTEQYMSAFAAVSEGPGAYHSAESLANDMASLAESRPEIAELREIGRSVEGRPILGLRIGERRPGARKLLFTGCHHAREWIAVEVPYLLAEHLVKNADVDPISEWLAAMELWVVPMVNPDGHEFTRVEDRLWRKNRRRNPDGSHGVDPNRNYGYMWGVLDVSTSSHNPPDETYVGPRAFSEPETRAVRDLIASQLFAGLITYHSYSQLILHPWGFTDEPLADPADAASITDLAKTMASSIRGVHGSVYVPQQSAQLYPTAGDTTDWAYGVYGIPAFTVELRPASAEDGGFILPATQIQPTWEENWPSVVDFVRHFV